LVKPFLESRTSFCGDHKDKGEKSDESSSNVDASFKCEEYGEKFSSSQELKEHTH
jgi:hypothetical protein